MDDVVICGYTIGKAFDIDWTDPDNIIIESFEPTVESGLPKTSCLVFDTWKGEFKDGTRADSPIWKITVSGIQLASAIPEWEQ